MGSLSELSHSDWFEPFARTVTISAWWRVGPNGPEREKDTMSDETGNTVTIAPTEAERVAAGIAWAESVGLNPGVIDPQTLNLRSNHDCALAQMVRAAFPDSPWDSDDSEGSTPYSWATVHYGLFGDENPGSVEAYGFVRDWNTPEVTSDDLQDAWVAALLERTED